MGASAASATTGWRPNFQPAVMVPGLFVDCPSQRAMLMPTIRGPARTLMTSEGLGPDPPTSAQKLKDCCAASGGEMRTPSNSSIRIFVSEPPGAEKPPILPPAASTR